MLPEFCLNKFSKLSCVDQSIRVEVRWAEKCVRRVLPSRHSLLRTATSNGPACRVQWIHSNSTGVTKTRT